jgi:hypothetical protein
MGHTTQAQGLSVMDIQQYPHLFIGGEWVEPGL